MSLKFGDIIFSREHSIRYEYIHGNSKSIRLAVLGKYIIKRPDTGMIVFEIDGMYFEDVDSNIFKFDTHNIDVVKSEMSKVYLSEVDGLNSKHAIEELRLQKEKELLRKLENELIKASKNQTIEFSDSREKGLVIIARGIKRKSNKIKNLSRKIDKLTAKIEAISFEMEFAIKDLYSKFN